MDTNEFQKHVSSWIDSYYNAEALEWLHRFINNSRQPQEVKDALNKQVDLKVALLTNAPLFDQYKGKTYLMDKHGHPEVFTTRYAVLNKLAEVRKHGYDAELETTGTFFRIRLKGYLSTATEGVELKREQI